MTGRNNLIAGFLTIGLFMVYGFLLIYLRDFAPNAAEWAANYSNGKHFEARLAHVHGALFAFLNIVVGYILMNFKMSDNHKKIVSWTSIGGLLMPTGIIAELLLGAPPFLVLIGALSMTFSMFFFTYSISRIKSN